MTTQLSLGRSCFLEGEQRDCEDRARVQGGGRRRLRALRLARLGKLSDTWELLLVQSYSHSKSRFQVLVDLHLLRGEDRRGCCCPQDQQGSLLSQTRGTCGACKGPKGFRSTLLPLPGPGPQSDHHKTLVKNECSGGGVGGGRTVSSAP